MGHFYDGAIDRHPRVVEHDVHGAERPEGLVGQPLHRGKVGDIAADAQCAELGGGACEGLGLHVGQHQVHSLGGEQPRGSQPDAGSAPRDRCGAAVEVLHGADAVC